VNLCVKIGAGSERQIVEPHGVELCRGLELEDQVLPVKGELDAVKEARLRKCVHVLLHLVARESLARFEAVGGKQLVIGVVGSALELNGFWGELLSRRRQGKAGSGKRHKESRNW
jgi:hypothetical protein